VLTLKEKNKNKEEIKALQFQRVSASRKGDMGSDESQKK
jgi:hypothetical protein